MHLFGFSDHTHWLKCVQHICPMQNLPRLFAILFLALEELMNAQPSHFAQKYTKINFII
jgi:hypothetical protein